MDLKGREIQVEISADNIGFSGSGIFLVYVQGGPGDGTSGRVARALYLDDAPKDFGPEVAFNLSKLSFQIYIWPLGQTGRAPRPFPTA